MIQSTNKFLIAILAAAVCAIRAQAQTTVSGGTNSAANSAVQDKITQLFGDPVVAKGKNVEVKQSQLDSEMAGVRAQIAASGRNIPPDYETMLERRALEGLINMQLFLATATDDDRTKGKEMADK